MGALAAIEREREREISIDSTGSLRPNEEPTGSKLVNVDACNVNERDADGAGRRARAEPAARDDKGRPFRRHESAALAARPAQDH